MTERVIYGESLLSEQDLYLFNEGSLLKLYEKLGAQLGAAQGRQGTRFGVWAPRRATFP